MTRNRLDPMAHSNSPRWLVLSDMHRNEIEVESLPPGADLRRAMQLAIDRLAGDGWLAEGSYVWGFVFLQRNGTRIFLQLTAVDPAAPPPIGHGVSFASVQFTDASAKQ